MKKSVTYPFMSRTTRLLGIVALISVSMLWVACDFNVEITDEKRSLNKIGGSTPCDTRILKGSSGESMIRAIMVDDNQNAPEAIDLEGLDKEPFNLKLEAIKVATDDDENAKIRVFSHETGDEVIGATATVEVVQSGELGIQPNPRNLALRQESDNRRVPLSVALLIDMSDTALSQDNGALRTAVPGSWVLENFNTDSIRGDFDIFSTILVRNDDLSAGDILFFQWDYEEDKYYTGQDSYKGFIYTTKQSRDLMSEKFISTGNPVSSGNPPMFAAISAAAKDLREHARDGGTLLYNPNLIAISLERDVALINTSKQDAFPQAQQRIRGSGWTDLEDNSSADFVPLQAILWHKPFPPDVTNPPSQQDWDAYADKVCDLVRAGGASKNIYFGNLFPIIRRGARDFYKENLKNALDMAYQASKGYVTLKVKYTLSGARIESGKRYNIGFKLQGTLLDQTSRNENSPYIYLTVEAN